MAQQAQTILPDATSLNVQAQQDNFTAAFELSQPTISHHMEKFGAMIGSGDVNQAAQGTAGAQRYAGGIVLLGLSDLGLVGVDPLAGIRPGLSGRTGLPAPAHPRPACAAGS